MLQMVMWHNAGTDKNGNPKKEQRCPYCFSRKLKVVDHRCAEDNETRFGSFHFTLKCTNPECGARCQSIVDIPMDGNVSMRKQGVTK